MDDLTDRIESVFRMVLGDPALVITDATTASDVEGWDSLAHINLMFSLESEFGIQFAGNEFARFTDVGDLRHAIEAKVRFG